MKIIHISDTHGLHKDLSYEEGFDMVIHSGDATNYKDYKNEQEFHDFLDWFKDYPVVHKIYVAGNHDYYIESRQREAKKLMEDVGIVYLHKESVIIEGIKFYGDPTTPKFGNWCFTDDRNKMYRHWEMIPESTDVLITHGPAYGIMDVAYDVYKPRKISVGCKALAYRLEELPNIKYHLFGHIHNRLPFNFEPGILNAGVICKEDRTYSNGSCVVDGPVELELKNKGNILHIN